MGRDSGFDVHMQGVEKITQLGKDLKEAGAKDLRREMLRAGREMGKPIKAELSASALAQLPKRGGLADLIAKAKVRVATRLSGRNVGVSFVGRWTGHDLASVNRGRLRHPIRQRAAERERGRKPIWVSQEIPAGYWDKVFDGPGADVARDEFMKAVDEVAAKLRNGG
jgi:SpoVK/Ycf46/Vps4 family AAA+-type ATPase